MSVHSPNLALLTDLYQLTMGYGYWKTGATDTEAVFHLYFRKNPFGGAFTVAAGLENVVEYLQNYRFEHGELDYLGNLRGNDGQPFFDPGFLRYLSELRLECDVDAVPEGTVVFPNEPLLRVRGPLLQAQLLETTLLNLVNFPSLIATKAARVCLAAAGDPVVEFGLRRAQGIDGAMTASRSAYIGGCVATSNVLAGQRFGIPVKGTHAHSWVMSCDDELEAFERYASALPANCVFLVDTYDTRQGVHNAVTVGKELRRRGYEMIGIRLDSGDLAALSKAARAILDEGGFPHAAILASNDLDEYEIARLKGDGAAIGIWGVGTHLVTAYDQPALGGVYKLSALRKRGEDWQYKIKLSEHVAKISTPGIQQVRRFSLNGTFWGDAIYDSAASTPQEWLIKQPSGDLLPVPTEATSEDLLQPVFAKGKLVYPLPKLSEIRDRAQKQIHQLPSGVLKLTNPDPFQVGIEKNLATAKEALANLVRSQHKG